MKEREFEVSSGLLPVVSVGTYESILSPFHMEEYENECREEGEPELECDWSEYKKALAEEAGYWIDQEVLPLSKPYGVTRIEVQGISSPVEYNYRTDELDFKLYVEENFFERAIRDVEKRICKNKAALGYMKRHYESHSGFVSFMPDTMAELKCYLELGLHRMSSEEFLNSRFRIYDLERGLCAYLTLALVCDGEVSDDDLYDEDDLANRSEEYIHEHLICGAMDFMHPVKDES